MMLSEFHFLRPEWFWAILPLIALLIALYYQKHRGGNWSSIIDPQLLQYVLIGQNQKQQRWPLVLLAILALLAITALAGPSWERLPQPVFKTQTGLVVILDLSRSMDSADLKPTRLDRARHKVIDLLKQRKEGQTALVVYAAQAFAITPLTDDSKTIITHVPNLTTELMPAQGSRADLAIHKAIDLFKQANINAGQVLLITDGAKPKRLLPAISDLSQAGHQLSVLGVGTAAGAPVRLASGGFLKDSKGNIVIPKLDSSALRQLGKYHHLTLDERDIDYLLNTGATAGLTDQASKTELNTDTWRDMGFWLLLPVILLSTLAFRRGLLVLLAALLLPLPDTAHAFDWSSLWLNKNLRAERALEAEQAEQAATLYTDPERRAAAEYRNGEYQKSIDSLQGINNDNALYNTGNAQAQLGDIDAAIESYQQALALNPEHADAQHNLEMLKKLKEQQQNQQQDGQQGEQQQNQQQDGQQGEQQQNQQQDGQQGEQQQNQQQDGQQGEQQQNQQQDGQQGEQQQNQQQDGQQGEQQQNQQQDGQQGEQQQNQQQDGQQGEQQNDQHAEQDKAQQAELSDEPENAEDSEQQNQQQAAQLSAEEKAAQQEQQLREQWLKRVPDNPGGLLKNKFRYQYRRQQHAEENQQW